MKKDLVVAIDLGASKLRAALISKNGKILKYFRIETPKKEKSETLVIKTIIVLINALLENYKKERVKGIGVSVAGPIDAKKGELVGPPNMPFKKVAIVKPLKKYFSLSVYLYNDCLSAVFAEKTFGQGRHYKDFVYISISSGIGGGVIADNRLLTGHNNNAAEIGHFIVDTKYNFPCSCRRGLGHWEGYCSGANIPRFFDHWLKVNSITKKYVVKETQDIFNLAKKPARIATPARHADASHAGWQSVAGGSDKTILKFIEEIGQINARGISNVIVAYDPEIIILGGGVVLYNQNWLIPLIRKNIDNFFTPPKIAVTPLKDNVCLLGTAALIFFPPKK